MYQANPQGPLHCTCNILWSSLQTFTVGLYRATPHGPLHSSKIDSTRLTFLPSNTHSHTPTHSHTTHHTHTLTHSHTPTHHTPGWYQCSYSCPAADVLLHGLPRIFPWRHQLLWETGTAMVAPHTLHMFSPPLHTPTLPLLLSTLTLSPSSSPHSQGIQFYTQLKTVTSLWRQEDAAGTMPTVMPTMK